MNNFKFLNHNIEKDCKQFSENIKTKKTLLRAKNIPQKISDTKLDGDMTKKVIYYVLTGKNCFFKLINIQNFKNVLKVL